MDSAIQPLNIIGARKVYCDHVQKQCNARKQQAPPNSGFLEISWGSNNKFALQESVSCLSFTQGVHLASAIGEFSVYYA